MKTRLCITALSISSFVNTHRNPYNLDGIKKLFILLCIVITSNANAQWTLVGLKGIQINKVLITNSVMYAGSEVFGVYKSNNNGISWTFANRGICDTSPFSGNLSIRGLAATQAGVFVCTRDSIYFSANNGAGWAPVHAMEAGGVSEDYYRLYENNNVLFAQVIDNNGIGRISRSSDSGITWTNMPGFRACGFTGNHAYFANYYATYVSTDNGSTVKLQSNSGLPAYPFISTMAVADTSLLYLAITNSGNPAIMRSLDQGSTWDSISSNLDYSTLMVARDSLVCGLGARGLEMSSDSGVTWVSIGTGLPGTSVYDLKFVGNFLYAATGGGIYKLDLGQYLGIAETENAVQRIAIFPNPVSSSATLQTKIPLHNATLTVHNCMGQTVEQIKNISGQTIVFNRNSLANGLYFIQLEEENKSIAVDKLLITDK